MPQHEDPASEQVHPVTVKSSANHRLVEIFARRGDWSSPIYGAADVAVHTWLMPTRDGTHLATDLYMPPSRGPLPVLLYRTPYGRSAESHVSTFIFMARRGYVVAAQDCRGTGDSEGGDWDYYMHEPDDGYDMVDWATRQDWSDGFFVSYGASYAGQTQWQMAVHPSMSAILPEVSGLGGAVNHSRLHMFQNAYARTVGNGSDKLDIPMTEMEAALETETMATGYFHAPLSASIPRALTGMVPGIKGLDPVADRRALWAAYCALDGSGRARIVQAATGDPHVTSVSIDKTLSVFGQGISHDRHTLPRVQLADAFADLHASVLLRTGWYDWGLNDALDTWDLLMTAAPDGVREGSRLVVAPSAHNAPGYQLGMETHPELRHSYATSALPELLHTWAESVRGTTLAPWPKVSYYLMGANEWRSSTAWPPPEVEPRHLYLGNGGVLLDDAPSVDSAPDRYSYDPADPTPTVGGSIVSYLYTPGSVDVSEVQRRPDVLAYSTAPLNEDVDVVGPLRMVLFASSSAEDTDFVVRLSDVLSDGTAIQVQSGLVRARFRDSIEEPAALELGVVHRFEVDMWATAMRFAAGHRIRLDVSSADFPRFERHSNIVPTDSRATLTTAVAHQSIHRSSQHASHLVLHVLPTSAAE